jgi:inner membrane protein
MDKDGFTATWKVLDFNRAYPQQWTGDRYNAQVAKSAFGVGLYTPVDFYQKSTRAAKYAILFVALMFAALFISEIVSRVRVHPIQYLFNGLAIITFYALLISLSEHTGFGIAYLVSSGAVTMLVTLYTRSVLGSAKLALILGAVLALVYSYAYWVLQMVDYALLAGSVGLFVVLSLIMFATRNIDWYAIKLRRESEHRARQSQEPAWEIDESRLDD